MAVRARECKPERWTARASMLSRNVAAVTHLLFMRYESGRHSWTS
jgi:hypothetical protein